MTMRVLRGVVDAVQGAAGCVVGLVHRRVLGPRRHTGPLPYVGVRPTTNPVLPVDDIDAAAEWYGNLGFDVHRYDDGYAWVRHCGWEWLHLRRLDGPAVGGGGAYLHVDDADAWRAAMAAASGGRAELGPLADMPWGLREFSFTDPSGNTVRIGHHI